MRYFPLLLPLLFFACSAPTPAGRAPGAAPEPAPAAAVPSLIVGYTGGWGGGPAYRITDGDVFKSTKPRALGMPQDIVATDYAPYTGPGQAELRALAAAYDAGAFAGAPTGFGCPEAARDATCPYFLVVTDGTARPYVYSQEVPAGDAAFADWMKRVKDVLAVLR